MSSFNKAKELYHYLNSLEDFYCPYPPESNILCFQFKPNELSDQDQLVIRYQLIESGTFYITSCEVKGKRYLRTVLMNPQTNREDYIALAEAITKIGTELQ